MILCAMAALVAVAVSDCVLLGQFGRPQVRVERLRGRTLFWVLALCVPAVLGGADVVAVAQEALSGHKELESISLPGNVNVCFRFIEGEGMLMLLAYSLGLFGIQMTQPVADVFSFLLALYLQQKTWRLVVPIHMVHLPLLQKEDKTLGVGQKEETKINQKVLLSL